MSVGRRGFQSCSGGGVSSDRNMHPGVRVITIGDYFWFVANPVAPQRLNRDAAYFCLYSLCLPTTKPLFLHASACLIVNLAPQPSQYFGMSTNPNPYLLCIASRHLSLDRDKPFTRVDWTEIQVPVSVLRVVQRASNTSMGTKREESIAAW